MDKEVIENATPEQFYENVSGRLYTLSLNQTGGVNCNMYCSIKDIETKDQKIADLESKLAESEKALEAKESVNQMYKATLSLKDSDFSDLVRENAKLKQQLAEKDDLLKTYTQLNEDLTKRLDDRCDICIERHKQEQNQTAIAVLEEVLDNEVYINSKLDFEDGNYVLSKIIRTKIEELKNGRN